MNMPPLGAEERGEQLATLNELAHHMATSDELGQLLEDLTQETKGLDPDSDEFRLVKVTSYNFV